MSQYVCPKCGSTNSCLSYPQLDSAMLIGRTCKDCGYKGTFLDMDDELVEKFQKYKKGKGQ